MSNLVNPTLNEKEIRVLDKLSNSGGNILVHGVGTGKALKYDTLIPTPTGEVKLCDLNVGDEVFGEDGLPTKILGVYPQGKVKLFKVTLSDGATTYCCDEHLWLTSNRNQLTTEDITEDNVLSLKDIRNNLYTDDKPNHYLPITLPVNYAKSRKTLNSYKYGKQLAINAHRYDDTYIEDIYKFNTVEHRINVLRGIFDTVGVVQSDTNYVSFISVSEQLAKDVLSLTQSLGGLGFIKEYNENYLVLIHLPRSICPFRRINKIKEFSYNNLYLLNRYIREVEYWGEDEAICIAVDNQSKLFLANDFIVTHNSRTSIQAAKELGLPTTYVVPASLKGNIRKEIVKWRGDVPDDVEIVSQEAIARGYKPRFEGGTLVVDESQNARTNTGKLVKALQQLHFKNKVLLSATPVYNNPAEIAPQINLAAGAKVLPENRREFYDKFIENKVIKPSLLGKLRGVKPGVVPSLKKHPELVNAIKKYTDYEPSGASGDFPDLTEEVIKVPLHKEQQDIYNTLMGKAPAWVRWKVRKGLPPNISELSKLQSFLGGARQVSNSTYPFVTDPTNRIAPKAEQAFNYFREQLEKNPDYKAVVYSNYLGSGLQPYKERLIANNIPFGEFSGEVPPKVRDQMVADYNANKLKALLISSAGAAGLDLKGTRLLQIMEPHFNREKERQIVGRARRYKSHADLPEDQRNVLVQRYLGVPKANTLQRMLGKETVRGTDEYISDLADRKAELNKQLMDLIARYGRRT